MQLSSLSILIPCYNVEKTIKTVVIDAFTVGRSVASRVEIIAVDDASRDATLSTLRSLQKKIPVLKILTHTQNKGYGNTIKKLYRAGTHTWLFSLPGDGQFDAKEIRKLLPFSSHADMILGWRKNRHDSLQRRIQSIIYNALLHILFGISLHDINTIRLVRKSLIRAIPLISSSAFVDAELTIKTLISGRHVIEYPIAHKRREGKGATGGKLFTTIIPTMADMIRFKLLSLRSPHA